MYKCLGNPVAMMNVPDIGQSSGSGARESEGPAAKTRKLSEGTSEARRFVYHSLLFQIVLAIMNKCLLYCRID